MHKIGKPGSDKEKVSGMQILVFLQNLSPPTEIFPHFRY